MPTLTATINLHPTQAAFLRSDALYRGFVGGRGAGKSWVGSYDLIRRAKPGRLYGAYAPTYPMLRDASYRTFTNLARELHFLRDLNRSELRATLGNGAEVLFRSLDDPERARGPNLSGAWIDEASLVERAAFDIIIACLREGGESGWLSATFTPKGRQHWTFDVFGQQRPNTALYHCRTLDNPFLPGEFAANLRAQYTAQFAEQELEGAFIDLEGGLARREWFPVVDAVPARGQRVRYWDFAATAKSAGSADPDWTVGTLMSAQAGLWYIEHVIRVRVGPGAVEALLRQTAQADGRGVAIGLEQEPGSSGKLFAAAMIRTLAGWNVHAVPATGDKVARAMPFLAQAEAGNVRLVRGSWVADWLDEVAAFPLGGHDDQVDSAAGAFAALTNEGPGIDIVSLAERVDISPY